MNKSMHINRKRQIARRKAAFLIGATLVIVFLIGILFGTLFSKATGTGAEDAVSYKYYTSIEIEQGDNLWDIANQYISDDYKSVHEYIDEIKNLNSLQTDWLKEGQSLMIPYYSQEFL